MKGRLKKTQTLEQLFPNVAARRAADASIDRLDVTKSMNEYLDTWECAYFTVAQSSPFREG